MKQLQATRASLVGGGTESVQAMAEYALLLTLVAVTAIGCIAAFGREISVSSTPVASQIISAR